MTDSRYTIEKNRKIKSITFMNGPKFELGQDDQNDDGQLTYINKYKNGFELIFETDRGEGYGRYIDLDGNQVEEDDVM